MTQEPGNGGFVHGINVSTESALDRNDPDRYSSELFGTLWRGVTSNNYQTLFGFRRFRTTHLLNLRFLEAQIEDIDRRLYQAGLYQDQALDRRCHIDRLGLKRARKDHEQLVTAVDQDLIMRLRTSIKEYDESLHAFNIIMSMETFSLADNTCHPKYRHDLHAYEKFKTRMLRVDLPLRQGSRDPVQHFLRKGFRRLWYNLNLSRLAAVDEECGRKKPLHTLIATWDRTYQNTTRIAEAVTRFIIGILTGAALVVPLVVLSYQDSQRRRFLIVILFVSGFCFLLSLFSKASNYETMAASAAYAAVLTVFVSNSSS